MKKLFAECPNCGESKLFMTEYNCLKGGKDKTKKDKKDHSEKKDVAVFINENDASKIIKSSKAITIQDLAKQTNVKISTANAFLKKALSEGTVKKVGGFSGH